MAVTKAHTKGGLDKVLGLVRETHWIKGNYISVAYEDGDGDYADGAIVTDTKVVGCLVGLTRLVGAKQPSYYRETIKREVPMPLRSPLSIAMEEALQETLDEYIDWTDEDEDTDSSIEGFNDYNGTSKDDVIQLLETTIARLDGK